MWAALRNIWEYKLIKSICYLPTDALKGINEKANQEGVKDTDLQDGHQ